MAVAGRFGADEAPHYDERILRLIPGYLLLQQLARAQLVASLPATATVLVVGAGTGAELQMLAPHRPDWSFVAADPAGPMLEVAGTRARTGRYAERVRWHTGHVAELPAELAFDGALMLLVAHFLPAGGSKQALFADVAARMRPRAPLVFADLALAAEPGSLDAGVRRTVAMELGMAAADADAMIDNMWRTLHPLDGEDLSGLLAGAGLDPPRPFFQALGYRGYVARRRLDW